MRTVQYYLGQTIYVKELAGITYGDEDYFHDRVGIVEINTEVDRYYSHRIYYPSINNAYLCDANEKIIAYKREDNPEYFL